MSGLDGPEKFFWLLQKSWSDKVSLLHIKGTQRGGQPHPQPLPHREGREMRDTPCGWLTSERVEEVFV